MNVILAGGGSKNDSQLVDDFFFNLIPKEKNKILYVPVAMKGKIPYDKCLEWFRGIVGDRNFLITVADDLNLLTEEKILNFGAIYIGGGNTYVLQNELLTSGFYPLLKKFLMSGGIVYGGSAGAVILGKRIDTSTDSNALSINNFSGLGLIDFCIKPHYKNELNGFIEDYSKKRYVGVLAIPEKSGIFFNGSNFKILGSEEVKIFVNGEIKDYEPGSVFSL